MKIKEIELKNNIPKICVPLVANDLASLKAELHSLQETYFDLIEWRIDLFDEVEDSTQLLIALQCIRQVFPESVLLVTYRTIFEGGNRATEHYEEIYHTLLQTKQVDILDIEYSRGTELFAKLRKMAHHYETIALASYHDFSKTPDKKTIMKHFKEMNSLHADIFKVALMPETIQDVLCLLEATHEANSLYSQPVVSMSMSKLGFITRVVGEMMGSAITFGSNQKASAPGQMNANQLHQLLMLMHAGL